MARKEKVLRVNSATYIVRGDVAKHFCTRWSRVTKGLEKVGIAYASPPPLFLFFFGLDDGVPGASAVKIQLAV